MRILKFGAVWCSGCLVMKKPYPLSFFLTSWQRRQGNPAP